MGGNSECIAALRKLIPGTWFVEDNKNVNIPPVNGSTKKTVAVIDAASWMYTATETLGDLANKSVARINTIAQLPDVEMIFFAHDRKTPPPKYALKIELSETVSTPPEGVDVFFARMISSSKQALDKIGTNGLKHTMDEGTIVLNKDFASKILSNRHLKEWVARYICQKVFEKVEIKAHQKLFVTGPNYERYRIGTNNTDFPSKISLNYLEADYFGSYIANLYSKTHDVVVYSIDTDTVLSLLLSWDRVRLPVSENPDKRAIDGIRFTNNVRVVRAWKRTGTPLQYIDIHELWKAIAMRGIELSQYHGVPKPKYTVATFVTIMTFCGNDYVRKPSNISVLKVLESYHRHCAELCGPLIQEGNSPSEFKLNCAAMLQLILFAYNDKKNRAGAFEDMQKEFEIIASECREEQRQFMTLKDMRLRCANTVWFMQYMLAQQTATSPPIGFETTKEGVSIFGYKRTSPTMTRLGWDAVCQDNNVDLSSFDLKCN